ncbi:MAG: hypothetical protein RMK97_04370 [Sutterellaceae bacterium]|nr:hypothetical protein [Burkholderiaceae bacterium]MCX7900710.1 hypothetical protein [Burkholderiaceae bacterium]MDW8429727.1 hypothetical protein [Sutterellaceae bacterium]
MPQRAHEKGVVLPLALVMLVVITLMAVVALRGVTTEERISANIRAAAIAFEQAELALRHCEQIATGADPLQLADARIDSTDVSGQAWRDPVSWTAANPKLQRVPSALYSDPARVVSAPVCLLEEVRAPPAPTSGGTLIPNVAYVVTARGFGDGNEGFRTTVQSQLRPPPF